MIDNLCADGLYLRLMRPVERGAKLSVVFRLSTSTAAAAAAKAVAQPRVAVKGVVLRSESKPGGACGVAITFERPRFLFT